MITRFGVLITIVIGVVLAAVSVTAADYSCTTTPWTTGSLNVTWMAGAPDCNASGARYPAMQVHQYDNSTFIIRQNKCVNYEAPFLFLLLGYTRALLIDTGATRSARSEPVRDTVETILTNWLTARGLRRSQVTLVVAHSHSHGDHISGDSQFLGQPYTTVVGTAVKDVASFFGISQWPDQIVTYDLGGRPLAIVPIPGHQDAAIAIHDCLTNVLFTGDSLYPGWLYQHDFPTSVISTARLVKFTQTAVADHVLHIIGAHVEMTSTARQCYPVGTMYQPREHQLQMTLDHLIQLNNGLQSQDPNAPVLQYFDDFVIYPIHPAPLPAGGRVAGHGMIVLNPSVATSSNGSIVHLQIHHIPMFSAPHDFQIILSVSAGPNVLPLPTGLVTLDPTLRVSLNDIIEGRLKQMTFNVYDGNFESGGTQILAEVPFQINDVQLASQLFADDKIGLDTLRYWAIPQPNGDIFLIHHINLAPDFDQVLRVAASSSRACWFEPSSKVSPSIAFSSASLATAAAAAGVSRRPHDHNRQWSRRAPTALSEVAGVTSSDFDEWVVMGHNNTVAARARDGQTYTFKKLGDPLEESCQWTVTELSCLLGPGFDAAC